MPEQPGVSFGELRPIASLAAVAPTICALLGIGPPAAAADPPLAPVVAGLGPTRRLLVLLVDALGVATWRACRDEMPWVSARLERRLIALESVIPCKTPVCFATIATGAPPARHGVRARSDDFAVPSLFASLAQAGRDHVVVGNAHSSTGLLYARYAARARLARSNRDQRVEALAREELEAGRAALIFCQLLAVDNAGHAAGPTSDRSRQAAAATDRRVAALAAACHERGYHLLLLADHGQHDVRQPDGSVRGTHDGTVRADLVVPCSWWRAEEL